MHTTTGRPGFGPVWGPQSRILLLGSYPSPSSFAAEFYYGHPQNRFWPLLALLCGADTPHSIEEKRRLILENRLALWDVLESCTITGAADHTIRDAVPNDIGRLVRSCDIGQVFCNGQAAHRLYKKHCQAEAGIAAVALPSTSPANAAFSPQRLADAWRPLAEAVATLRRGADGF